MVHTSSTIRRTKLYKSELRLKNYGTDYIALLYEHKEIQLYNVSYVWLLENDKLALSQGSTKSRCTIWHHDN